MNYEEKQTLNLWWLYILIGVDAIIVSCIILFDKGGMSFEDLKDSYFAPFWAVALPFLLVYAIQKSTLTLLINQNGISYKYSPFATKLRILSWQEIDKVYLDQYDAMSEYGGFGVRNRLWFKFNDKAYLLNDKSKGLKIELKNGRKLLFSTNRIGEMELFLFNLKTRYHITEIQ